MDRAGHEFLAGAGFAEDEHIRLCRRDGRNLGEHLLQRRTLADDVAEADANFVLEQFVLHFEVLLPRDTGQRHHFADDFVPMIAIGRGLDVHPIQPAILAFHLELKRLRRPRQRLFFFRAIGDVFVGGQQPRGLAEQFFRRIAGDVGDEPVGVDDPMVRIDDHHPFGEALEGGAIKRLRVHERFRAGIQAFQAHWFLQSCLKASRNSANRATQNRCPATVLHIVTAKNSCPVLGPGSLAPAPAVCFFGRNWPKNRSS